MPQPSTTPQPPEYAAGFRTLHDEFDLDRLQVEGRIPAYVRGSLLRIGPAQFEDAAGPFDHHFDGLGMWHRFHFGEAGVSYRNRFARSEAYRKSRAHGSIEFSGFGTPSQPGVRERLLREAQAGALPNVNAGVAFAKIDGRMVAMTDGSTIPMYFDGETLDSQELLLWDDALQRLDCAGQPVKSWRMRLTTAHSHLDPLTGDHINYFTQLGGGKPSYNLYRVRKGSRQREPLAYLETDAPAYMHAFCVTEHHIVLPESPLVIDTEQLAAGVPVARAMHWAARGMRLHVIRKADGQRVRSFEVDPVYAMHTLNAFERDGEICVDLCAYADKEHVFDLFLDPAMRQPGGRYAGQRFPELRSHAKLTRYILPLDGGAARWHRLSDATVELGTVDYDRVNGRPYRCGYLTGISPRDPGYYDQIARIDVERQDTRTWSRPGLYAGEPIFVADPDGRHADAGVLLSLVLDSRSERSLIQLLDAETLGEVAQVHLPHHVPAGFHGVFRKDAR
ncbi:carotenoid oxygenase family protein [Pseudorhodoferax sp.]|uniref:carotenoid oxygenase family protein n=1 Tax=Pseudorhodoferax sp. TaxID=1993553 RepID=UPI002DD6552E|nr:carotenoid oxygenase family protein [Pseudorhodoferax sp.]